MTLTLNALLLILLGALCHATWNIYSKHAATSNVAPLDFIWGSTFVSVLLFFPLVVKDLLSLADLWTWQMGVFIALSASLHLMYSALLQKGYRVGDYGVVYPLARGSGALFSSVLAIVFLAERPHDLQWLGLALLIFGIFWVSGARGLIVGLQRAPHNERVLNGLKYGLMIGGLIAFYSNVDGYAVKHLGVSALTYYWLGMVLRTSLLVPVVFKNNRGKGFFAHFASVTWQAPYRNLILIVGLLSPAAYWFVLLAVQTAPISFVAPLREVSMLFAMLLGAWILKEKQPISRIFGALAMVFGILFLF